MAAAAAVVDRPGRDSKQHVNSQATCEARLEAVECRVTCGWALRAVIAR
jgi:hypothetical protein